MEERVGVNALAEKVVYAKKYKRKFRAMPAAVNGRQMVQQITPVQEMCVAYLSS